MAMVKFDYSCSTIDLDEDSKCVCFKQEWIRELLEQFGIEMHFNEYNNVKSIDFNNPDYRVESYVHTNDGKGSLVMIGCPVSIFYKENRVGFCYISGASYSSDTHGIFKLYVRKLKVLYSK